MSTPSHLLSIYDNKNIIFLLVDDLGSGDVDICPDGIDQKYCPFSLTRDARRTILHTPRLRRMAEEGQILTNFYSPRAICTPSRAGLLMGRDPDRYGMYMNVCVFTSTFLNLCLHLIRIAIAY